LWAFV